MVEEVEEPWPLWAEQATKGDVIRAIVYQRAVVHSLSKLILATSQGDKALIKEAWDSYFMESDQLTRVLNEIGGLDHA